MLMDVPDVQVLHLFVGQSPVGPWSTVLAAELRLMKVPSAAQHKPWG